MFWPQALGTCSHDIKISVAGYYPVSLHIPTRLYLRAPYETFNVLTMSVAFIQ